MNKKMFSIGDIFVILRKRWWVILICGAVVASLVGIYSVRTYHPVYRTITYFFVRADNGNEDSVQEDVSKMSWALKVINSYTALLRTNNYATALNEKYDEMFPQEAGRENRISKNSITATPIESTNAFKLSIISDSPESALNYSRAAEEITPAFIDQITGVQKYDENGNPSFSVYMYDQAVMPKGPLEGDNLTRNIVISFVAVSFLSFLVFFLIDLFDVRIKGEDDLLNNYTLPIIGTIPSFEATSNRKKAYKYGN